MQCLFKYKWVKLMRAHLPEGKGIMAAWARLASRAAFRKGTALYCGHINAVSPGTWAGGVVGLKSILGVKSRTEALKTLERLSDLGYIQYELDCETKKLTYQVLDWVLECSGEGCMDGAVYAAGEYGFLCLPRNITERLVQKKYVFEDADAWLDLWCHTTWKDKKNVFSLLSPSVQYNRNEIALTLEKLGQRWGWEKTKVWRFFQKHGDVFALYRLPGSYGCLIFNRLYPTNTNFSLPESDQIKRIIKEMRANKQNTYLCDTDHNRFNQMISSFSLALSDKINRPAPEYGNKNRVAYFEPILRAYYSHGWNCKNCKNDCRSVNKGITFINRYSIRGPCQICEFQKRSVKT